MNNNRKVFINTLIGIVLLEILSFLAFVNPGLSPWIFGVVSILIIIATVYKLELGVFIAIAELIIGSLGKILVLELNGFDISLRMAIWIILLCVWFAHILKNRKISFLKSRLFVPFCILCLVIFWGIIFGVIRSNSISAIFSDVNNYFYFALIFPIYGVLRSRKCTEQLYYIMLSAGMFIALKTIILFYIFSHEFFDLQDTLYLWLRATRLAEITNIDPNILLSRIFMQSHIWLLFLLFIYLIVSLKNIVPFICKSSSYDNTEQDSEEKENPIEYKDAIITKKITNIRIISLVAILAILMSAIIMSFSRSFWLAFIITFLFFACIYFIRRLRKKRIKKFFVFIGLTSVIVLASIGLTLGVASFPIPKGSSSADLLRDRAGKFKGESALSSRYAQIKPMLRGISIHPVIGSGFGTSVTYESQDPRVLKNNPDGKYTTTAFELGWLEIWLKLGLIGVFAYLYFIYKICEIGYKSIKQIPSGKIKKYSLAGLCLGLISVTLTHLASPYLNHPLGIGIVIICASLVERKYFKKTLIYKN